MVECGHQWRIKREVNTALYFPRDSELNHGICLVRQNLEFVVAEQNPGWAIAMAVDYDAFTKRWPTWSRKAVSLRVTRFRLLKELTACDIIATLLFTTVNQSYTVSEKQLHLDM